MIGSRIKRLRELKGYSITELAEIAEVSKSYLSYIERDLQTNPSLQFLGKIVGPLSTTLEVLLGHESHDDPLDEEWRSLIKKSIEDGISKEDFRSFTDFIRYKKWSEE